jgi:hypothetical protein
MKKFLKCFGMIAIIAIIGFAFAACDNPAGGKDDPDSNVWTDTISHDDYVADIGPLLTAAGATQWDVSDGIYYRRTGGDSTVYEAIYEKLSSPDGHEWSESEEEDSLVDMGIQEEDIQLFLDAEYAVICLRSGNEVEVIIKK